MLGDSNAGFAASLQDLLNHRKATLQKVLMGQMNPLERRLELAGRRPGILFGTTGKSLVSDSLESTTGEKNSTDGPEEKPSGTETAGSVKIEAESPNEDELRVASFLAEKHSDAETVVLSNEDTVEVREESGGTFIVEVDEVLDREFGESETESVSSGSPSMSEAVAIKRGLSTDR
jgi:hypothetical protein